MIAEVDVPWIKPRYLWKDTDRYGTDRLYVKRPGFPKIRIKAEPDSDAFWAAYALALNGRTADAAARPIEPIQSAEKGSLAWLIARWKESEEFRALADETRTMRSYLLDACCLEPTEPGSTLLMGKIPIGRITGTHIRMLRDRKKATPEGANNRLKALRVLFTWMLEQTDIVKEYKLTSNPARDVSKFKSQNPDGFHTWTVEEVAQFEAFHKPGSMARLALSLFLFTGQRRSDVVRFGRQHIRQQVDPDTGVSSSWLIFTQQKNRNRKPVTLQLPVLDVLQSAIAEGPCGHLTLIVTQTGKPFTVAGFGNRMRKWCNEAGLPLCAAHGLRKAGACIAAENGATDAQMMAIFGWTDPRMASKYRKKASQRRIAGDHMHLMLQKKAKAPAALPLLEWNAETPPATAAK